MGIIGLRRDAVGEKEGRVLFHVATLSTANLTSMLTETSSNHFVHPKSPLIVLFNLIHDVILFVGKDILIEEERGGETNEWWRRRQRDGCSNFQKWKRENLKLGKIKNQT